MNKLPKTYCRLPFNNVTVSPTGRMQICCISEHNFTFDSNKRHINEFKDINEWFHGPYMNKIRDAMLNGKYLKECAGCYKLEKLDRQSLRNWENDLYLKNNSSAPLDKIELNQLNVKFGNKCNLKCKMCFPYSSSELWKEWKELGWNINDPNKGGNWKYYDSYYEEDYDWPTKKENLDKLKAMAQFCNRVHFTGGEPMISPALFRWLKHCIDKKYSKDIDLEIVTNGTKIHPRFCMMAEQFKSITIHLSIDGLDNTYDYIRYPGNFKQVEQNFKFYHNWLKDKPNAKFAYNFTLQIFNLHILTEFIKKFSPLCINIAGSIIIMRDPIFMTYQMLDSKNITNQIKKLISLDKVTTNKFTKQTIWKCLHELGRPLEGISNNESWTQLKQFVNTQDKHRGINIKNYIPDLAKYFQ